MLYSQARLQFFSATDDLWFRAGNLRRITTLRLHGHICPRRFVEHVQRQELPKSFSDRTTCVSIRFAMLATLDSYEFWIQCFMNESVKKRECCPNRTVLLYFRAFSQCHPMNPSSVCSPCLKLASARLWTISKDR